MIGKGPKDFTQSFEYKDFRGNLLHEGDTVVYAMLSGRSCQIGEATVVGIAVKDRIIKNGHWSPNYTDPNRTYIYDPPETVQDYKLQLRPTGRYGRWSQHATHTNVWNSVLGKYDRVEHEIKPVWVMAEQATLVK